MEASEFGQYLKEVRKRRKLTIRQLDTYSGVSHSYISQMERGERGVPSPEILRKLSKPLGVEYEELMERAGYITKEAVFSTAIEQGLLQFELPLYDHEDPESISGAEIIKNVNHDASTYKNLPLETKKLISNEMFRTLDPETINFFIELFLNKEKQMAALKVMKEIKDMKEEDVIELINYAKFKKNQSTEK